MTAKTKIDKTDGAEPAEDEGAGDAATEAAPEKDEAAEDTEGADGALDEDSDDDADDADGADDADAAVEDRPRARVASGVGTGAAAIVGAALGLASLTGTWLGDLMSSRQELIGNIDASSGTPEEQVAAIYGTPWHTIALFNGLVALVAVLVAGAVLLRPAFGAVTVRPVVWVRAVAVAGLVLGGLGLIVSGVMWFDVFTELPEVPAAPAAPAGQ